MPFKKYPTKFPTARISGNEDIVEKSVGIKPVAAICMPEMQVVSLVPPGGAADPSIMYFPACTRILQCGGCCQSALLACTPIEMVTKIFEVTKYLI